MMYVLILLPVAVCWCAVGPCRSVCDAGLPPHEGEPGWLYSGTRGNQCPAWRQGTDLTCSL